MSKHQQQHEDQHATETQPQAKPASAGHPATEKVRELLAGGSMDAKEFAAIVAANPRASHEIFTLLHQTVGNRFASQVLSIATSQGKGDERKPGELGTPRDIASFDISSELREGRATIDHPHREVESFDPSGGYMESRATVEAPPERKPGELGTPRDIVSFDISSELREGRATIDGPPKSASFDGSSDIREDRATIDHPHREVESFDPSGDYMESRATVDAPPDRAPGSWVAKARRYNRAHADKVRTFLEMTGSACVDESTGEADPRKVARWQVEHGVPPDGRVGDKTVEAAAFTPA